LRWRNLGQPCPLAVAAVEDKIVQGAVAMVLSAIHEADFLGFSYGVRPGRGQHDALVVGIDGRKVTGARNADRPAWIRVRHPGAAGPAVR
jgi:RNA-directed DNA polymerase